MSAPFIACIRRLFVSSRPACTVLRSTSVRIPVVVMLVVLAYSTHLSATETVGSLRGRALSSEGNPIVGANIRVTDVRTNRTSLATTDNNGVFSIQSMEVGGPYRLEAEAVGYRGQTLNGIFIQLGQVANLDISFVAGVGLVEEIVVTVGEGGGTSVAVGPTTNFDATDLESAPTLNRDIRDLIRLDPRIYINEAFMGGIQCNGANPRFNSLTVDGVRLNDQFGLNDNGYPTERMPFAYDAVRQVAVEIAPFDVQYGGFSACNINAVTKSGSSRFSGGAFYMHKAKAWVGDSLEGDDIDNGDFTTDRFGFNLGGPIVTDRVFFFVAYEKFESANLFDRGPVGSGRIREIEGVSQADYDEIERIAREVYEYEPGELLSSAPTDDEKLFLKLSVHISDRHRATLGYTYNDGFNNSQADSDDDELEFSNHFYERGARLDSVVGQLFSQWNDSLSTEIRIGYIDLDNRQLSLGGTDFGEVQVSTETDLDGDGNPSRATVYLGADDSRHANQLNYENWTLKLSAAYVWRNHHITAGFEYDTLEIFNLFIQEAEGEYIFDNIEDFENGIPSRVTYENAAPSNNIADAAAKFSYQINTLYMQDEMYFGAWDLTVVAGLRYDWYSSDDKPAENEEFVKRYGFSNDGNLDGEGLLQPRIAFDWGLTSDLRLRGGFGVFSGGNPNVWVSNNYSNNGFTQVEEQDRAFDVNRTLFTIDFAPNGQGRPIWDIPQNLYDDVASGEADSSTNSLDPDFKIPYSWKFNLGATYRFDAPLGLGRDYVLNVDYIHSQSKNSAVIRDLTLAEIGEAADGRPLYKSIDRSNPDCTTPASADCSLRGRSQDFQLTNVDGDDARQRVFSLSLAKQYDWGLAWTLGYAYVRSEDVNPMGSSVAFSNFANIAVSDPNDPSRVTSNYEIPHRLTLRLQYKHAFFGDNVTRFTLFGNWNQGRPFSFVFDNIGFDFGDSLGFIDRHLLYVPTGTNDPIVDFAPTFDAAAQDAFFALVDKYDLQRGEIATRNDHYSSWWLNFDLKVEQEFPLPLGLGKGKAFFVIKNLGNLLNDDWGVLKEASFPRSILVVDADYDAATGLYTFNEFLDNRIESRSSNASLWQMRFGVSMQF